MSAVVTQVSREKIVDFEKLLKQFEQYDFPLEHFFGPGVYVRKLFIPATAVLTGKIHKHEHLNICTGDISVLTEDGIKRLTGQHIFLSSAGTKRVGYAHTDTTWVTIHQRPADETNIEALEALYVVDSFEQLEGA